MHKKVLIGLLGLTIIAAAVVQAPAVEVIDRIVATVNGEIITKQEIDVRVQTIVKQMSIKDQGKIEKLRKRILNTLVDQKLIEQENNRLGILVTDKELESALANLRKRSASTKEEFEANVIQMGMPIKDFETDVRGQLNKIKYVSRELRPRVIISDEQIIAYYKANPDKYKLKNKVLLKIIVLKLPFAAGDKELEEKIAEMNKIVAEIKSGLPFGEAAKKYSEAPNAKDGGDIGMVRVNDLSQQIKSATQKLREGQFTKPLKIGKTIQIIQVVQKFGQGVKVDERTKARINQTLLMKELEARYNKRIQEIRKKSAIEIKL